MNNLIIRPAWPQAVPSPQFPFINLDDIPEATNVLCDYWCKQVYRAQKENTMDTIIQCLENSLYYDTTGTTTNYTHWGQAI